MTETCGRQPCPRARETPVPHGKQHTRRHRGLTFAHSAYLLRSNRSQKPGKLDLPGWLASFSWLAAYAAFSSCRVTAHGPASHGSVTASRAAAEPYPSRPNTDDAARAIRRRRKNGWCSPRGVWSTRAIPSWKAARRKPGWISSESGGRCWQISITTAVTVVAVIAVVAVAVIVAVTDIVNDIVTGAEQTVIQYDAQRRRQ